MATQIGVKTAVSISLPEGTYGTEASRVVTMTTKSASLHKKVTNAKVDHLSAYLAGALDTVQTNAMVEGETVVDACYSGNGLGILLMAAFGAVAEAGAGPYTHTFTVAEALKGFSQFVQRGTASVGEEFYGMVAAKTVIKFEARGVCTVTTTWMGRNAGTRAAASPSAPALASTRSYILGHHVGTLTFNSVTYACKSITLTIDNKVALLEEHGSILVTEPTRSDRVEVTLDVEIYKRDDVLYNANLANTTAAWAFTASFSSESLAFSGSAAFIESHDDAIDKPGATTEKLKIQCLSVDGSSGPIQAVLTNADATYGAS